MSTIPTILAIRAKVHTRGNPPLDFLAELVAWGKTAPEAIFAVNSVADDIYSSIRPQLGPWTSVLHRRAAMLEVLRVLGGFESSWDWSEGRDTTNPAENSAETISAGLWQVSYDSRGFGVDLREMLAAAGIRDGHAFQAAMKENHPFAMEYTARLIRRTTRHHGPLKRKEVNRWLSRDAVAEFQTLLTT